MTTSPAADRTVAPLTPLLVLTFLTSISTGVVWSGIPFIAEQAYGFSRERNLVLSLFMGAVYVVGALLAGPVTRRLETWLSPRAVLGWILILLTVISLGPVIIAGESVLWLVGGVSNILFAFLWPIVESFLSSGRHGAAMRSAIGWFNMVWTSATAASLFLIAPLMETQPLTAIIGLSGLNLLAAGALKWFAARPEHHDPQLRDAAVQPEYPLLLRAARILLPAGYLLAAAMTPIMPHRWDALGVPVQWQTPALATWQVVRVIVMALMWKAQFWHGRWGTLMLGMMTLAVGFGLIVLGTSVTTALVGLGVFGVGMGLIYYAALYYGLAVGHAAVDAGGMHEALIGIGYTAGPLAALGGIGLAAAMGAASPPVIVAVVWTVGGIMALPAVEPYRRALKASAQRSSHAPDEPMRR
jgi:MFS family permease